MAFCRQKRAVSSVMNKTGTETVHRVFPSMLSMSGTPGTRGLKISTLSPRKPAFTEKSGAKTN